MNLLWIGLGGALGAISRYLSAQLALKIFPFMAFLGTLIVNSLGSFLIGFLFFYFKKNVVSSLWESLFIVGFLGGYTTFSTYVLETYQFFLKGEIKLVFTNILLHHLLCFLFVFLGAILGKSFNN